MFLITDMDETHIDQIHEIELRSFAAPWSKNELKHELQNKHAIYKVALKEDTVAGYAGMWHIVNEGQITNIAVDIPFRRMGLASALLEEMIKTAREKEMMGLTLEVRVSNTAARNLYKKYGFVPEGIRKNYYRAENNSEREDAVIMWKYMKDNTAP